MRINHNVPAINANRMLNINSDKVNKGLQRLSSGLRINFAGDDAAGLAISEKMRAQVKGIEQAIRNSQDGISLIQTAEGALEEAHKILQRLRVLSVQSANDTNTTSDREIIQVEVDQVIAELDRISSSASFNRKKLLDGSLSAAGNASLVFQIGSDRTHTLSISISTMSTTALGINILTSSGGVRSTGGLATRLGANSAIALIDSALDTVSTQRAELGAYYNRMEHATMNLTIEVENVTAAESRIRDTDMADEMMKLTKNQILTQAGTAMLAQANAKPQSVLPLLG